MAKKYWHKESDKQIDKLEKQHKNWGQVNKIYSQPKWCKYPEALSGVMGCWSLVFREARKKISKKYCKNCECFSKGAENAE